MAAVRGKKLLAWNIVLLDRDAQSLRNESLLERTEEQEPRNGALQNIYHGNSGRTVKDLQHLVCEKVAVRC